GEIHAPARQGGQLACARGAAVIHVKTPRAVSVVSAETSAAENSAGIRVAQNSRTGYSRLVRRREWIRRQRRADGRIRAVGCVRRTLRVGNVRIETRRFERSGGGEILVDEGGRRVVEGDVERRHSVGGSASR